MSTVRVPPVAGSVAWWQRAPLFHKEPQQVDAICPPPSGEVVSILDLPSLITNFAGAHKAGGHSAPHFEGTVCLSYESRCAHAFCTRMTSEALSSALGNADANTLQLIQVKPPLSPRDRFSAIPLPSRRFTAASPSRELSRDLWPPCCIRVWRAATRRREAQGTRGRSTANQPCQLPLGRGGCSSTIG